MKFRDLLKVLDQGIEFGVARKVRDQEVISLFSVILIRGRDGNYRAVLRARRLAKEVDEDEITVRKAGKRYDIYAPGVRFRVRSKSLAETIAEALVEGEIQVDIEGPSAKGIDGNPLSAFAQGITTAIGFANLLNSAKEDEAENEEESEDEEETRKPRKRKKRRRVPEDEEEEDEEEEEEDEEEKPKKRGRVRKVD